MMSDEEKRGSDINQIVFMTRVVQKSIPWLSRSMVTLTGAASACMSLSATLVLRPISISHLGNIKHSATVVLRNLANIVFERVVRNCACASEIQNVSIVSVAYVLYLWCCPGWLLVPRVSRCGPALIVKI